MTIKKVSRKEIFDLTEYTDGITRKLNIITKKENDFIYYYIKNKKIISDSSKEMVRIKKLQIPPSWGEFVWISSDNKSKIQAIGIDLKGKKQYRYHIAHIEKATEEKYLKLSKFIKKLPTLEKNIINHSKLNTFDKYKVISTMLKILKQTYMRVGKDEYAKENKSYGLSSLKKKHLIIKGDIINFKFKGKSNQKLHYIIMNNYIKEHLLNLEKLDGDKLFKYIEDNKIKQITYKDLNSYIQEFMNEDFTIKDFRTYAANYNFVKNLISINLKKSPKSETAKKSNLNNALDKTAKQLKHTKAISKKSYIMEFIQDLYINDSNYFNYKKSLTCENIHILLLDLINKYKKSL